MITRENTRVLCRQCPTFMRLRRSVSNRWFRFGPEGRDLNDKMKIALFEKKIKPEIKCGYGSKSGGRNGLINRNGLF